jgi:competence protein ComEA
MIKKLLILAAVLFSIATSAAPVNVNTADAKTIADSLSGIGLKKAQAIVDYRAKNGDFKTVDDLSQVSGIGVKTIEKNKSDILLTDSAVPTTGDSPKQPSTESATKVENNLNKVKKPK